MFRDNNYYQENVNCFEILVTETVQLSRAVLFVNAECFTAWNTRLVEVQLY